MVLTRNAPTSWYEGPQGPAGPEYDLVKAFARQHKLKLRFEIMQNIDDMLAAIQNNRAQILAAGITRTELRDRKGYHFGPEYDRVRQLVVCRRGSANIPQKPSELVGKKLQVIAGSSYIEALNDIKDSIEGLSWTVVDDADTETLLQRVWKKQIDCTVADSNIFNISQRYYPELVQAFVLRDHEPLAWVLAPEWKGLYRPIGRWLDRMRKSGELDRIHERYYGHIDSYDYVDVSRFKRRIKTRLPKYRKLFQKAAKKHEFPWTLLAAQAYQESHWNPNSQSPTGVRGLMMLTQRTAKSLGVSNRLDPAQSINGGARYLKRLYRRLPEQITGKDRLWFALAAYNVGYGHLKDARSLARKLDKDPDKWVSLKEVLPLLSDRKYHKTLPHGYARGHEPVQYVQRIREYHQILLQHLNVASASRADDS